MLQRIQTVYLALALAAVVVSFFLPWVSYTVGEEVSSFRSGSNFLVIRVLIGVSVGFILWGISMFKERSRQMRIVGWSMWASVLIFIGFGVIHFLNIQSMGEGLEMNYGFAPALPLVAAILLWMARKAIKKDDDLVKSVDRLR